MEPIKIKPIQKLHGTITLPGDKSISHRAAILAGMSQGKTKIKNFSFSDDCFITLRILKKLGAKIATDKKNKEVVIVSRGFFTSPKSSLFMGESGTSARIFLGLLSAQPFASRLTGAPSLLKRPMERVICPLRMMGARLRARQIKKDRFLPIDVSPSVLYGIQWTQKIPSAQVKSAVLLAGLFAEGETIVKEPVISRDHTERMLKLFGADIKIQNHSIRIKKSPLETPKQITIPGDISSATFFIVLGLLVKNSKIIIRNVGVNPTRMGAIKILKKMGGRIKLLNKRDGVEPVADILVSSSDLCAAVITSSEIPSLIDELPILMVAASLAKGRTKIEGVRELRVKETDRIESMRLNLVKLGVSVRVKGLNKRETIEIKGSKILKAAHLRSFSDHRTAMSMVVAGLAAEGVSHLDDISCANKSFPEFLSGLKHLFAL
jgi:3-phosphoshikimate 1-carboxyvinyltransferase